MFRMRTILTIAALALGLAACANNSSSSAGAGGLYGGGRDVHLGTAASSGAAAVATAEGRGPRHRARERRRHDALPVRGRHRLDEHLQRRVRRELAAAHHQRERDRDHGRVIVDARHDHPRRRLDAGDLQRAPALPLQRRHRRGAGQRRGDQRLRRSVVRRDDGRDGRDAQRRLGVRQRLRRQRRAATAPAATGRARSSYSRDAGVAVNCDAGVPRSPAWSTTP